MRLWSVLLLWLAAVAVVACYETPTPECAFSCGDDGACPTGYTCRPDGWCKREGVTDDFQCAPPRPDAMPVIDAGPDAGLDGGAMDAGDGGGALVDEDGFSL